MADGIIFRTTDGARWGAGGGTGTGGNLTPLQVDENMWELLTRMQALEDNPPAAVSIQSITVVGSQFQVNLTDGSHQGPFTLPIATFRALGQWVNGFDYKTLDMFTVPHIGLFMVLIDHTSPDSPAPFDPNAIDEDSGSPTFGQPLYQLVFGEDAYIYDVGFFYPGKIGIGVEDGAPICGHEFAHPVTLTAGLTDSVGSVDIDPAADMAFPLQVNGVTKGSFNILAGHTAGTFTWADDVSCVKGDRLTVLKPTGGVDLDARSLYITIVATREF